MFEKFLGYSYTESQTDFNLMALVSDRKMLYERQLNQLWDQIQYSGLETENVEVDLPRLRLLIEYEETKMVQSQQEMIRRRHDYLPFLMSFLKILAEEKKLTPLLEKAKERAAKKGPKRMKV